MFNLYSLFYPCLSVSSVFEICTDTFATSSFHVFAGRKTIAKKLGKNTKANNLSWSLVFDRGLSHAVLVITYHSDLNDQNSFHSTIDAPPGVSKNPDHQTEVHSGELER